MTLLLWKLQMCVTAWNFRKWVNISSSPIFNLTQHRHLGTKCLWCLTIWYLLSLSMSYPPLFHKIFHEIKCHENIRDIYIQWVPGKRVQNLIYSRFQAKLCRTFLVLASSMTYKSFCLFECIRHPTRVTYQWCIVNWSHWNH